MRGFRVAVLTAMCLLRRGGLVRAATPGWGTGVICHPNCPTGARLIEFNSVTRRYSIYVLRQAIRRAGDRQRLPVKVKFLHYADTMRSCLPDGGRSCWSHWPWKEVLFEVCKRSTMRIHLDAMPVTRKRERNRRKTDAVWATLQNSRKHTWHERRKTRSCGRATRR